MLYWHVRMASNPSTLKITDLKKVYKGEKGKPGVEALNGVSLTVESGEFFGLLGPNGAGKSSLIGITAGLTTKNSGTIEIAGVSLDANPDLAKASIGLVPQEVNLDPFEKVINTVVDQAGYYGIPRKEAIDKANVLMKDLGIWDKRDQKVQALSGGMKRRLLIARALVHSPKILLLDEPTAGVDVELRRGMYDFLRELNASGTTIILTTHYLEEVELLCRRVAIVNHGTIIEQGSVKELLKTLSFTTLVIDTKEMVTPAQLALLSSLAIKSVDENTLELTLNPGDSVNDAVRVFSKIGISITNIRNNGSRLEEVFMNLTKK
jgi:ABC-2 type transport system ATP-binding protein